MIVFASIHIKIFFQDVIEPLFFEPDFLLSAGYHRPLPGDGFQKSAVDHFSSGESLVCRPGGAAAQTGCFQNRPYSPYTPSGICGRTYQTPDTVLNSDAAVPIQTVH